MPQDPTKQGSPTYGGVPVLVSPVAGSGAQLSSPGAPGIPSVDTESQKATYSYATASLTLVATPTDILQFQGAADKVIRLKRARIQIRSTVSGALNMALIRRSTANAGGTSASGTVNKYDPNDPTASMTVRSWSSNPTTTGTTVSSMYNFVAPVNAAATPQNFLIDFTTDNLKGIVLRGTSDYVVFNGGLSTLTNADNALTCTFEWTEEPTGQ